MHTPALVSTAYVSYSQLLVFDSSVNLPGLDWTDQHFGQGFARQASCASFRTLVEYGDADFEVWLCAPPALLSIYNRVVVVPFDAITGRIRIEGPEESSASPALLIQPGNYRLTIAQTSFGEESEKVDIYFERLVAPLGVSAILVQDAGLTPSMPLVETAATAETA